MSAKWTLDQVSKLPLKNQREVIASLKTVPHAQSGLNVGVLTPSVDGGGANSGHEAENDATEVNTPRSRPARKATRAEFIAHVVLQNAAGLWYVAANDTQRNRATRTAADLLEPFLAEIERDAERRTALNAT